MQGSPQPLRPPPARATDPAAWLDQEPRLRQSLHEVVRLLRRARGRVALVIVAALLVAAGVFATLSRRAPRFVAQVTFRLVEASTEALGRPPTPGELREHVLDGVFVKPRVLRLIRAHGLYPSKARHHPSWAYQQMRRDLEVDVHHNTFLTVGSGEEVPRSARLTVRYTAQDPDLALGVAKDLARMIREHERDRRRHLSMAATEGLQRQRSRALARLTRIEAEQARKTLEASRADPVARGWLQVDINRRQGEISALRRRLAELSKVVARARTRGAMEQQGLGITFEEVDWRLFKPRLSPTALAAIAAAAAFPCAFLVLGLLVGAADPRVYDLEDVRRLGLDAIGVAAPPTAGAGAYDAVAFQLLKSGDRAIGVLCLGPGLLARKEVVRICQALVDQTGATAAVVHPGDHGLAPDSGDHGPPSGATAAAAPDDVAAEDPCQVSWIQPRVALLRRGPRLEAAPTLEAIRSMIHATRAEFPHHLVDLGGLARSGEYREVVDTLDMSVVLARPGGVTRGDLLNLKDRLTPAGKGPRVVVLPEVSACA